MSGNTVFNGRQQYARDTASYAAWNRDVSDDRVSSKTPQFGVPSERLQTRSGVHKNEQEALSVSAASAMANSIMEEHTFRIVGEVSELSNKSGYKAVYFTIKDEKATLPCMMWNNQFKASGVVLELGAKVVVTGKFSFFAPKGRMNFKVSQLTLEGDGILRQRVAQLAQKLRAEGLMDPDRKPPLPELPQTIGLVTSPHGAVVHDVLRTLRRRYPVARVVFAGVPVEGKQVPETLIKGLETVRMAGAEVTLLVRGGGSFEDFMPFNDETLARYIALSPVPIVTGIGHEPDTCIADMVAALRTSSPTQAADFVVPHRSDLAQTLATYASRMSSALSHRLRSSEHYLDALSSRPLFKEPASLFASDIQLVDLYQGRLERQGVSLCSDQATTLNRAGERFEKAACALVSAHDDRLGFMQDRFMRALPRGIERARSDVDQAAKSLRSSGQSLTKEQSYEATVAQDAMLRLGRTLFASYESQAAVVVARLNDLSPLRTLERGWSIVTNKEGTVVSLVNDVEPDDHLKVQLSDGALWCRVEEEAVSELSGVISMEDLHDRSN